MCWLVVQYHTVLTIQLCSIHVDSHLLSKCHLAHISSTELFYVLINSLCREQAIRIDILLEGGFEDKWVGWTVGDETRTFDRTSFEEACKELQECGLSDIRSSLDQHLFSWFYF